MCKLRETRVQAQRGIACSQTLYFLFKVHQARVINYKLREINFIDRQHKGVGVGEEENLYFSFLGYVLVLARSLHSPMFLKRTKRKIKRLFTG